MQNGKPAPSRGRQEFPALKDDIGEDPARWLDRDLITPGATRIDVDRYADGTVDDARVVVDRRVSSGIEFVDARIRGIDHIEVVRAWIAVERALGRGPDGGPREQIIARLEKREQQLEQIGERPERLEDAGERTPAPPKDVVWSDTEDGSRPEMASVGNRHPSRRDIATDGGDR